MKSTEFPSQWFDVSSHILLSRGRSFANEMAGDGPISFAVNLSCVPLPRVIIRVFTLPLEGGAASKLTGVAGADEGMLSEAELHG